MTSTSLTNMTITELAPRIKSKEISPVEVTQAALTEADRQQHRLNSFITLLPEQALAQAVARESAIAKGDYLGPLDGIPIGLKDNIATAGILTTVGAKAMADHVPAEDAAVVAMCKAAGAVVIGKENLHEFAAGGTSENPHYGPVRNPWDTSRIPGGSSGGGAANVASGVTYASLGSDLAGSVRIPASFCGIVAMKATYGRVSNRGYMVTTHHEDHIGPMTRTVADNALVLQAIAGYDPLDPTTVPVPVPDFSASLGKSLKGIKVGVPSHYYFDNIEPEIEAAVRNAIDALGQMGAELVDVSFETVKYSKLERAGMPADVFVTHEPIIKTHRKDYGAGALAYALSGQFVTADAYVRSLKLQRLMQEEHARVLQQVDVVAAPTMTVSPRRIGEVYPADAENPTEVIVLIHNTVIANQTSMPALSVPCGVTTEGLPIGFHLMGRPFEEALLYNIAHQYEQVSPAAGMRPPQGF